VTEVVSEGVKPLSKYNDLVYVGKVKTFIRNNMKDYSNLSISDLLDIANERNNEIIKCNKQFKKANKCFCATCPINNKRLGQISAELRFGTGPGLDLTGTWSTNVGVFARSASGIGVSDFKVYSTEVFYSPTGPTPTPRPTVTPTSVPLQGFVPTVLGGVGSTAVCSKSDRFCSLQFTASFRNPNSQYIYKPVFWKSGLGRFIDGYGIWRSDSNIYPASQQDTVDPVYGTVSTVVNIDNPGVVGSYGGTIYAAGKFCYNMADPATCTKVVPSASIAYKLIVVPDVTPTPVAAYCGLGGIYSYVNCNVKDGGYVSAKYDCYNGPTKLYTGSLSYSQCTSLSDIKKQASLMCAKRCSILKETVGTLKKGL
jgi:hypothetical protein